MRRPITKIVKTGAPIDQSDIDANNGKYVKAINGILGFGSPAPDLSGYWKGGVNDTGNFLTTGTLGAGAITGTSGIFNGQLKILEGGSSPTKYTIFQGGDQTVDLTYTLPTAYPSVLSGVLKSTTAGVMSWDSTVYQPQLNGTGFVKASGTTISYDNSTYYKSGSTVTFANITDSALTAGRVVLAGTAGILSNNANLTFSTDTLVVGRDDPSFGVDGVVRAGNGTSDGASGGNLTIAAGAAYPGSYSYDGFLTLQSAYYYLGVDSQGIQTGGDIAGETHIYTGSYFDPIYGVYASVKISSDYGSGGSAFTAGITGNNSYGTSFSVPEGIAWAGVFNNGTSGTSIKGGIWVQGNSLFNGTIALSETETDKAGAVSGHAYFSQPFNGPTYKKVVIRLAALNGATSSYTFPTAFLYTPSVMTTNGLATTLVTTLSTTGCVVTGATSTGWLFIEGY